MKSLKPILKWAGGKRWLVPHLLPIWEKYADYRLVEPFCGGMPVALALRPARALLNDINHHLINFYRWVQQGLEIGIPMENDEKLYYEHRSRFNELIRAGHTESREAAELFYYLNKTGFNGLCRFNRKGEYNVPFGRYRKINYATSFPAHRELFRRWMFMAGDFEEVPLQKGDFVYADPPYDVEFVHYSKEGFTWEDQVRLVDWLSSHDGPVAVSNQATDRIVQLYEQHGFRLMYLDGPRSISANGKRQRAREVLATRL